MTFGGNIYWLTFGIANDGQFALYHGRLTKAVAAAADGKVWGESASFFLFRSKLDLDALAGSLSKVIRDDRDFILIGMPYQAAGRILGNWKDDRLLQLMPYARLV